MLRIEWHGLQASQKVYFNRPLQPRPSIVPTALHYMCFLLIRTTALVREGKGRRQHNLSKLHDNADAMCAVHACKARGVCALGLSQECGFMHNKIYTNIAFLACIAAAIFK